MMLASILLISLLQVGVLSTCYNPDGSVQEDQAYKPCIAIEGAKTMCCALNRTNPSGGLYSEGWTADLCLGNGLCANLGSQTSDGETDVTTVYWRDQCWTSDWNNTGNCLNFCMEAETSIVTPCDGTANSTTWCCGSDTDCCGTSSAINIAQYFGDYSPSNASRTSTSEPNSSTSTGTSTTHTTSSSTKGDTATTNGASSDTGMSSAEKAAIGLGVALGVTLVASALAISMLWRQKNQLSKSTYDSQMGVRFHRKAQGTHELHSATSASEVERPNSHILELAGPGSQ